MANNPSKTWAKLATAGDHDLRAQTAGLAASYQSSKAAVVDDHQGSEPLERRQTDPARIDPATGEPIAALEVAQITDIDGEPLVLVSYPGDAVPLLWRHGGRWSRLEVAAGLQAPDEAAAVLAQANRPAYVLRGPDGEPLAARARPALSDRAHVHRPGAARPRRGPH